MPVFFQELTKLKKNFVKQTLWTFVNITSSYLIVNSLYFWTRSFMMLLMITTSLD